MLSIECPLTLPALRVGDMTAIATATSSQSTEAYGGCHGLALTDTSLILWVLNAFHRVSAQFASHFALGVAGVLIPEEKSFHRA